MRSKTEGQKSKSTRQHEGKEREKTQGEESSRGAEGGKATTREKRAKPFTTVILKKTGRTRAKKENSQTSQENSQELKFNKGEVR